MRAGLLTAALATAASACIAPAAPPAAPPVGPAPSAPAARVCPWPGGAKAAVSLTYDDAMRSQLEQVAPALKRHDLPATFFLSGSNLAEFSALVADGHELGAHTVTHPCNPQLASFTAEDMGRELDAGIAAVHALGPTGKLTFAYPCGQQQIKGGESYVPLVRSRFRAARGVAPVVAEAARVDLFSVPALFPPAGSDGSDAIEHIESAAQSGGWAVLGVHGIDEGPAFLRLSAAAHERILSHLAAKRAELWVAPFGAVADAVAACQAAK